jgi:hypothetical protein
MACFIPYSPDRLPDEKPADYRAQPCFKRELLILGFHDRQIDFREFDLCDRIVPGPR